MPVVSDASNIPQHDIGNYLRLYITYRGADLPRLYPSRSELSAQFDRARFPGGVGRRATTEAGLWLMAGSIPNAP